MRAKDFLKKINETTSEGYDSRNAYDKWDPKHPDFKKNYERFKAANPKGTLADFVANLKLKAKENVKEDEYDDDYEDEDQGFFVALGSEDDGGFVGMVTKDGGKWRESRVSGKAPYNWGGSYMGYLTPDDVMSWIRKDYGHYDVKGPFSSEEEAREYAEMQYGLDEGRGPSKGLHKKVTIVKGRDAGKTGYVRQIKTDRIRNRVYLDLDLEDGGQAVVLKQDVRLVKEVDEGWESGPEERAPRERDPDDWYDQRRQEKLDAEAELANAKRPQEKVYTLLGRGPNYEPNYKFPGEYKSQEDAIAARAKLMADPNTPNPRDIGIHSFTRYLDEDKQRLDPKCWKGYRKQGTKMKGDVRVNNCVKVKK